MKKELFFPVHIQKRQLRLQIPPVKQSVTQQVSTASNVQLIFSDMKKSQLSVTKKLLTKQLPPIAPTQVLPKAVTVKSVVKLWLMQ